MICLFYSPFIAAHISRSFNVYYQQKKIMRNLYDEAVKREDSIFYNEFPSYRIKLLAFYLNKQLKSNYLKQ